MRFSFDTTCSFVLCYGNCLFYFIVSHFSLLSLISSTYRIVWSLPLSDLSREKGFEELKEDVMELHGTSNSGPLSLDIPCVMISLSLYVFRLV